jgi:predicted nucleotidyltransferase
VTTSNSFRESQASVAAPLVHAIHDESQRALGDDFLGMLLLGSLALGDFDPLRSDVDFLVVTRTQPNIAQFGALRELHERIRASALPFAKNYEGVYIPLENLRRYRADDAHAWLGSDGHFAWETQGSDWILQRHVAREHGFVVSGPPPHDLIDPVPPHERVHAAAAILREWWAPKLDDRRDLRDAEYQAYAILTMCRTRYTLATAEIVGKPAAAHWLAARSDARTAAAIMRALQWRHGAPLDEFDVAVQLIREALAADD